MKNSEFLNNLLISGKIKDTRTFITCSFERLDNSIFNLEDYYNKYKGRFLDLNKLFMLLGDVISKGLSKTEETNIENFIDFMLNTFVESGHYDYVINSIGNSLEVYKNAYSSSGYYNVMYTKQCGNISINGVILQALKDYDIDKYSLFDMKGLEVYTDIWYIEKDLKTNEVSVKTYDKDSNIFAEKDKFKIVF